MRSIDIDDKLDELIIRYKVDRFHPRFSKKRKAKQLLRSFLKNYEDDEKVIFVAGNLTDRNYFVEDSKKGIQKYEIVYYEQVTEYAWEKIEGCDVIIVSFYGRERIMSFLHSKGITAISIYDYFAENGLILEGNYYDIFGEEYHTYKDNLPTFNYDSIDMNAIFFFDRRNYEIARTSFAKEMYLARMIFDCVCVKDWNLVNKYIDEYLKEKYSFDAEYMEFKKEIALLLAFIKENLKTRNEDDIIIFWIDNLEFGDDRSMPFLRSLSDISMDFMNAYTVTPYTHATAKTLFAHKYVVDDRSYKLKVDHESAFIQLIKDRGGVFCFYTYLKQVDECIKGRLYQNQYTTLSESCWNMLMDILQSEKPVCSVIHEISSTHPPYISFGLSGDMYFSSAVWGHEISNDRNRLIVKQREESRRYTDDILKLYSDILPDNDYKIYLSDHGHTELDKFHTIFRIVQENIQPKKIQGMFSYINFDKLLYKILQNDNDYSDIIEEYIKIQDVDYYNKENLKFYLHKDNFSLDWLWGYQGIITQSHYYIRYHSGQEKYYNNSFNGEKLTEEKVDYLRNLCNEYPNQIIWEEQFKYTRNMYATFQNYLNRNGCVDKDRMQTVLELFNNLPRSCRIAIRGGGKHTLELWFILKKMQQEKVAYVIDQNKKCMAARLGLEIIDITEITQKEIDVIIVSSYEHEETWCQELCECINIPVIGLYDYLKEKGFACKTEFYKRDYKKEDVVWEE